MDTLTAVGDGVSACNAVDFVVYVGKCELARGAGHATRSSRAVMHKP